jgi:glyoxylase-like metal-dependent hydrolase (beta-lactamase superfamily II)
MPGWRAVHTPGHTAGHISLFRELDRVLITGDAIVTMNHDSAVRMFIEQRKLHRPPAAFTTDWEAARESIQRLAELRPTLLITGHGRALSRPNLEQLLERFAVQVQPPMRGRYAQSPARCDESGVIELPPPVPDSFPKKAIVAALAVACGLIMGAALRRRKAA